MKAVVISHPGPPNVLQLQERPTPTPADHEVLIRVYASGVNRPDVFQRKGNYPPPPGAPADIPGLEVAGTVEAIGDQVKRWKIGDRVCALIAGGGYAEYCIAPEGQCLPIPGNLSFTEAASLPETYFTVWSNVFERAWLQSGESLLVHGGSSGIGVTAIQIASAMGSNVYATAGTDDKCRFCEALGSAKTINYNAEDFADAIAQLTSDKGVDVILDMVGGSYTSRNLQALAVEGRLVMINSVQGKDAQVDLSVIMRKRIYITGSMLRSREESFKAKVAQKLEQQVWPLLASGKIKAVIYKTFEAQDAAHAHQLMEDGSHMGKIVLEW